MKSIVLSAGLLAFIHFSSGAANPVPAAGVRYSSYLGGGGRGYTTDTGYAVTVGGDGSIYVLGQTSSEPFPHTAVIPPGGFDTGYGTFVTKLSPDGRNLVFSTFLSGLSGRALAVDSADGIYVTGETGGVLPAASSAQPEFGGATDAFVLKLNPDGQTAAYATYLGGSDLELGRGIAVDSDHNAYIVGWTTSTNLPVTPGAAQPAIGGGYDAFVAKLNADGTQVLYMTYLGGTAQDSGAALALDAQRRVVVVGRTASTTFATAPAPTRFGSDKRSIDAYVARLSADGGAVDYLSLIAGEALDTAARVVLAADGSPVVLGHTESSQLPVTSGAWQKTYRGGRDLFVARLGPDGGSLIFCTYVGSPAFDSVGDFQYAGGYTVGGEYEEGTGLVTETGGLALDTGGNILITALTGADNWPEAASAGKGSGDALVAKLSAAGDQLLWLNFIGGRGEDYGFGLAHDGQGGAWVTGEASRPFLAPYLPTTPGSIQPQFGGGVSDAFVIHLSDQPSVAANDSFNAREPLAGTRLTTLSNNAGATKEPLEPDHAGNPGGHSLWWTWTAPANGRLILDTLDSAFPGLAGVYTGGTLAGLQGVEPVDGGDGTLRFPVAQNVTYAIAVDGRDGASGDLVLHLTFSQPVNDDLAQRVVLDGFPVIASGSNINATAERLDDTAKAGVPGGQSVWWEWTSPTNGIVAISTSGSDFNTTLGVFTGDSFDNLVEVKSNDNYSDQPGADQTSQLTFPATLGTRYVIGVDGYYAEAGMIRLSVVPGDPPPNDDFANRAPLDGFFAKVGGSTVNATTETALGEKLLVLTNASGNLDFNSAGYTAWWTWTAPTNGRAQISTSDITFDTRLAVYTGTSLDQLQIVAAGDNRGGTPFDYSTLVRFQAATGTAYQIMVDGNVYGGHSGTFTLNLALERPPVLLPGSIGLDAGGQVHFQAQGLPGVKYQVQSSVDLKAWVPLDTLLPETEFFTVTEQSVPSGRGFFRLVVLE